MAGSKPPKTSKKSAGKTPKTAPGKGEGAEERPGRGGRDAAPNYSDAIRVVQMLRMLSNASTGGLPIATLAKDLEVHPRTVTRYIEALQAIDGPDAQRALLERFTQGRTNWVRLTLPFEPLAHRALQYAAVYAASRHFAALKEPVLSQGAENVLDNIMDGSADEHIAYEQLQRAFHYVPFGPKDYSSDGKDDIMDAVVGAILHRRTLRIHYRNVTSARLYWQWVEPFTLVMYRDGFYLLARIQGSDAANMRLYALDRITEAEAGQRGSFTLPEDFDPTDHFKGRVGIWQNPGRAYTMEVAFDPEVVTHAKERTWPGFQSWTTLADGRALLTCKAPITPELKGWLLSWGATIEVMKPSSLRLWFVGEIHKALGKYV